MRAEAVNAACLAVWSAGFTVVAAGVVKRGGGGRDAIVLVDLLVSCELSVTAAVAASRGPDERRRERESLLSSSGG